MRAGFCVRVPQRRAELARDAPVPAEASFTYTATSESQGEGTITFRTVSNRGIAERTGLTPGSVRVNLHRGMALLSPGAEP